MPEKAKAPEQPANRAMHIRECRIQEQTAKTHNAKRSNKIRTTKYTIFSFLVFALYYEMKKFTNLYMIVTLIIQAIPTISTLELATTYGPLLFVLFVALVREAVEDYYRYKKDKRTNRSPARVFDPATGAMALKRWSAIREGDLILLVENEETPADLLLLYSKGIASTAFVETSNLDGEKNLKAKRPVRAFRDNFDFARPQVADLRLTYPPPNSDIYFFEGVAEENGGKTYLTKENFIPRGVFVKNTRYLLGVAVYVGSETKIMLNNMFKQNKVSSAEKMMNVYVYILVLFEVVLLVLLSSFSVIFVESRDKLFEWWGLEIPNLGLEFLRNFLSYFILLNTFLPISLLMAIETIRFMLLYFYKNDASFDYGDKKIMTNTMTLNEELGKIQFVLSDKTGTLTQNVMVARNFCVGLEDVELSPPADQGQFQDDLADLKSSETVKIYPNEQRTREKPLQLGLDSEALGGDMASARATGEDAGIAKTINGNRPPSAFLQRNGQESRSVQEGEPEQGQAEQVFPFRIDSADQDESLLVKDGEHLKFFFYLLVNTCHECFAESLHANRKKKFKMNVLPENIMKESVLPVPNTPKRKLRSCFQKFCVCCMKKKNKKTILDDVPQKAEDSSMFSQSGEALISGTIGNWPVTNPRQQSNSYFDFDFATAQNWNASAL